MENNGKNPSGRQGEGSRRHNSRQAQAKHARQGHGQGAKSLRDSSTLGVRKEEKKPSQPPKECALCGKPIFDLAGALADKESGAPVHFDCALERILAAEPLEAGEKIVYLGAGCFGVVE